MMQPASEAFRIISGDAYAAWPRRTGRRSAGRDRGRRRIELAGDLSKGARFQLYLALRLAGYRGIRPASRTGPFIADDIMETFDDSRSAAALRLLSELGHRGQVIYLTHHQHLAEIAKEVCPEARVHELAA